MKGTLNYREYNCPCGGHINRRIHRKYSTGIFKKKYIYEYYYDCIHCETTSEIYTIDVTDRME